MNSITNRDNPNNLYANFAQPAKKLPDSSLKKGYSLFPKETKNEAVGYDSIVYDTYDYMDQVLSFSLADTLIAAFEIYKEVAKDIRAERMIELLRYNTNDQKAIPLLRYGFPPEICKELSQYIEDINEENISFSASISKASDFIKSLTKWYLPI